MQHQNNSNNRRFWNRIIKNDDYLLPSEKTSIPTQSKREKLRRKRKRKK